MNFRQAPSKFKNQILTAQKRDQFHAELDLTKDAIGNDATRTVQANADTIIFSCGNSGVGFVPLQQPGKFGFSHQKLSCGHVSDIHLSPFILDRLLAISTTDQSVRIYQVPNVEREEEVSAALHEVRASAGTANTPVLLTWNPQVSGILAIGSGTKVDIFSIASGKIVKTIDVASPVITLDWSHDGSLVLVISRDATLRIIDPRQDNVLHEVKLTGTKQIVKSLPDNHWVVSSLSRMRERELNFYALSEPSKPIKTWNFGTASTPLIPILDTVRKIVYLLDKSGGTLRWIEMSSPFNEGAAGTSVEQSTNACLIHPFGLQIMDGEINRVLVADTKGNTVPVKITIGRKSYNEFHDDLFTPIEVESTISSEQWLEGTDGMAKVAKVEPALLSAFSKGESISKNATTNKSSIKSVTNTSPTKTISDTKNDSKNESKNIEDEITDKSQENSISTPKSTTTQQSQPTAKPQSTLSAREQRKWDREEAKSTPSPKVTGGREVYREDLSARRAEYGAPSSRTPAAEEPANGSVLETPVDESTQLSNNETIEPDSEEAESLGKGRAPMLEDEDALEKLRSRRVTPALEAREKTEDAETESESAAAKEPVGQKPAGQASREVFRENLGERRAEYGAGRDSVKQASLEEEKPSREATPARELREVFRENLGERRAEYGASSASKRQESARPQAVEPVSQEPERQSNQQNGGREVYREDLSSRRAEYGAPSKSSTPTAVPRSSTPALSAREQRKWDKEESSSKPASPAPKSQPEIYREDKTARRAEYGAVPSSSQLAKASTTAEREVFKEDLTARRAEYGASTPILKEPTTAYKEITQALGKSESEAAPAPPAEETIPYKKDDDTLQNKKEPSVEELENAYAPPIEDTKVNEKKVDEPVEEPKSIVDRPVSAEPSKTSIGRAATAPATSTSAPSTTSSSRMSGKTYEHRQYTRKYLEGKPQHPRNSYTSLIGLNASLPNTARMIHTTPKHLALPLAGPGGRIAIIPAEKSGRLPALLSGFTGGAQVVDFELDRFQLDRLASAHVDNCVKIWAIPSDFEELEGDVDSPEQVLKGMDRILAITFHPLVKNLLLVTTATKLHLFDVSSGEEIKVFPTKGVANSCWSLDGSRIALGKSDKSISIVDARSGDELQTLPSAHSSSRPFRLSFVGEDRLITAGFGRGSTRELALYDLSQGKDIQVHEMDISPSPFALPHFDEMSSILYLIPRGSSNILPFHITGNTIVPLTAYTAADPIMGTAFFATQDLDTKQIEIARCVRLSTNEITVVGFHIPRPAGDFFHDDIYPEQVRDAYASTYSIKDWLSGSSPNQEQTINLNPRGLKGASAAGIGSVGKKASSSNIRTASKIREPESKKPSELDEMFSKAKNIEGDEPENFNKNKNTEWD